LYRPSVYDKYVGRCTDMRNRVYRKSRKPPPVCS
jgi:hypothetical protein